MKKKSYKIVLAFLAFCMVLEPRESEEDVLKGNGSPQITLNPIENQENHPKEAIPRIDIEIRIGEKFLLEESEVVYPAIEEREPEKEWKKWLFIRSW